MIGQNHRRHFLAETQSRTHVLCVQFFEVAIRIIFVTDVFRQRLCVHFRIGQAIDGAGDFLVLGAAMRVFDRAAFTGLDPFSFDSVVVFAVSKWAGKLVLNNIIRNIFHEKTAAKTASLDEQISRSLK